jgi:hypothetical protein
MAVRTLVLIDRHAKRRLASRPETVIESERQQHAVSERLFRAVVAASTFAVAAFLVHAVTAWRPHEDEVLALFTGRGSFGELYDTVFRRGGAPLHFTIAWAVVHLGGGLTALRACSAFFAVASVPVVALLASRLAGRTVATVATPLLAASWTLLFHGVYARMYSLFLVTSALSYLALLYAIERRGRRAWALWTVAILATIATHTYGAIVLASQGLYVLAARPLPLRKAVVPFAAVAVVGIPFWWIDLVLAGRYDIGVGGGGSKLSGPLDVLRYFLHAAGDFTVGRRLLIWPVLAVAALGLARLPRRSALLAASVLLTPIAIFLGAKVGGSASPETRHMIFALPFVLTALAAGLTRLCRPPLLLAAAALALACVELQWTYHRQPELFTAEAPAREQARESASRWLAGVARHDDVLLGYDPIFLGAWEDGGDVSRTVVPRADAALALTVLRDVRKPLGHGLFVFDASDTNNWRQRLYVGALSPFPRDGFEVRSWGPFLVVRTVAPTRTVAGFLARAREAELLGKSLLMGDADVNYATVADAIGRLGGQ